MAGRVAPMPMEETEALTAVRSTIGKDDDCDPYLKINIPSLRQTRQTMHKTHDRNPDWNETLTFHGVTGRSELLDIAVMVRACPARRTLAARREQPLVRSLDRVRLLRPRSRAGPRCHVKGRQAGPADLPRG